MCQGGRPDTGKLYTSSICLHVCGSTHGHGCMVNDVNATTAY